MMSTFANTILLVLSLATSVSGSFWRSASNGDETAVKSYVEQGGSIDCTSEKKYWFSNGCGAKDCGQALHLALIKGHKRVVKILVKSGTNVNYKTDKFGRGKTPLHLAVENRDTEIVRIL
jgi:ankyrin repeat protein